MLKITIEDLIRTLEMNAFGDYKEYNPNEGHSFNTDYVETTSFYGDLHGKILTFIEAISDEGNVEQRKSIIKQLLTQSQKKWLEINHKVAKNNIYDLQETRIIDGVKVPVEVHKIK